MGFEPLLSGAATNSSYTQNEGGISQSHEVMPDWLEDICIECQHFHETRAHDHGNDDDMVAAIDGCPTSTNSIGVINDTGSDFYDSNPMFEPIEGIENRTIVEDVVVSL